MSPLLNKIKKNRNSGFSLIEVLVAMFIIGVVGVAFLLALATATKALILADIRTVSESLARSQLELVKKSGYLSHKDVAETIVLYPSVTIGADVTNPARYLVDLDVTPYVFDSGTGQLVLDPTRTGDDGLQLIQVTVFHDDNGDGSFDEDEKVLSLDNYKSIRGTG